MVVPSRLLSVLNFTRTYHHFCCSAFVAAVPRKRQPLESSSMTMMDIEEPDAKESNFGRRQYWDESYRHAQIKAEKCSKNTEEEGDNSTLTTPAATTGADTTTTLYSWYGGWEDELGPFVTELFPNRSALILIPGIGNDPCIRDMYDIGNYHRLMGYDYAPAGIACAKQMFGPHRLQTICEALQLKVPTATVSSPIPRNNHTVMDDDTGSITDSTILRVCDARNLTAEYATNLFDGVFDKGTYDAIYLSGGKNKTKATENLALAVAETKRIVKEHGIVFSVTAACVDAVRAAFANNEDNDIDNTAKDNSRIYYDWTPLRDGNFHITADGYTSNNVDATMLAWQLTQRH